IVPELDSLINGASIECNDQEKEENVNSTNNVNAAGTNGVNAVGENISSELLFDLDMPALEDICTFNITTPKFSSIMPPKRTSTSAAPPMTQTAIKKLVGDSVSAALETQAATMANTDNTNSNCTEDCKVKYATGTLTEEALSWWNSFAQHIGIEESYKITWTEFKNLLIKKFQSWQTLMEVFIGGLPRSIEGNVTASKPQTLEEAITITQRLMDQVTEHNSMQKTNDHKRKFDDRKNTTTNNNYHNNHNNGHHQQHNRRHETFRAYAATPTRNRSWIEAMQEELLQFKLQEVLTLVDLPNRKRAIGTKWVFRNKKDERGIVIRNKARLLMLPLKTLWCTKWMSKVLFSMERLKKRCMYVNHQDLKIQTFSVEYTRLKKHCMDYIKLPEPVNPTIYDSCIEQFCSTVMTKTINEESQIHAKVDDKEIIITESSVRRDLRLADEDGVDCFPNSTIFENLKLMGAATTASSLDTEQNSGNIDKIQSKATPNEASYPRTTLGGGPRCQEAMRDAIAQTRFENVSKLSNDLLLARGNILRSDKDSIKLNELMKLYTNLQLRVLALKKTKTTQALEITSLKRRVKKLEKSQRSRTHKLKRLYKVGLTARVDSSEDEQNIGEDASKQGRIEAIDADEDITLVNDQADAEMFDVTNLHGEEVFVEEEDVDKEVNDEIQKVVEEVFKDINTVKLIVDVAQVNVAGKVNAASIATTNSAAATITIDEVNLAKTLTELKASKPKVKRVVIQDPSETTTATTTKTISSKSHDKGKGIMVEELVKPKKKEQIKPDEEVALKLQAEFEEEQRLAREKAQKELEANIYLIET
nr:reverse transcriptase domain-containing protein [Tanacetum cinerariifolium]